MKSYSKIFLFVSLSIFSISSCQNTERELKKKENAAIIINNVFLGKNYLAVDPSFAVGYLITESYDKLEPFFKKTDTDTFVEQSKSTDILTEKLTIGLDYYLAPFVTIPLPSEYTSGTPINPDTLRISAKVLNKKEESVAEWDAVPIYPQKVDLEYQLLTIGSTLKITLDNEKQTPPDTYRLLIDIKDTASDKKALFEHHFELIQPDNQG